MLLRMQPHLNLKCVSVVIQSCKVDIEKKKIFNIKRTYKSNHWFWINFLLGVLLLFIFQVDKNRRLYSIVDRTVLIKMKPF